MARNFEEDLETYAQVITRAGLNLQEGQPLLVSAPVDTAPLVRQVAKAAYSMGSPLVEVIYKDPIVERSRYLYGPKGSFGYTEEQLSIAGKAATAGHALLSISSAYPGLMDDVDPEHAATYRMAVNEQSRELDEVITVNGTNWCVAAAPSPQWANFVFPKGRPAQKILDLWREIFNACRVYEPNPQKSWKNHSDNLRRRAETLNKAGFAALNFLSSKTNLTVPLVEGHIWEGGASTTTDQRNIMFSPNIPTEEVFTMPHRLGAEGRVTGTRPVVYNGITIDGYVFEFAGGEVVDFAAVQGQEILSKIIQTDANSSLMGEIALVSMDSPLARAGITFGSTLFDENTRSHFALGRSYRTTVEGGEELSSEELISRGGNISDVHVDFMIGSADMDVYGITQDGGEVSIMREGIWVPLRSRRRSAN